MNFMDRINAGLLGPTTNYGGLLNPEEQQNAQRQASMAMFANLLAASGPSDRPTSLGQAIGGAVQAGRGAQNEGLQQALQAQLMRSQITRNERGESTNAQRDYGFYAQQETTSGRTPKSFEEWKRTSGSDDDSEAIKRYKFWLALPDEKSRNDFLTVQRSMQPYQLGEMGGGKVVFNKATGQWEQASSAADEAAGAGLIRGEQSRAGAIGEASGAQTAKAPAKASFDVAVASMREQIGATMTGMVAGPAGTLFDYGDKKLFNSRNQQLSTEIRTVFRIPGEGTLSDQEQAQYGLQLPSTDNPPDVNAKILDDLEARVNARQNTPIGGTPPQAPRGSPAQSGGKAKESAAQRAARLGL